MHLVACLYRFTPFGGLERNALELLLAARARGHRVRVFTRAWHGAPDLEQEYAHLNGGGEREWLDCVARQHRANCDLWHLEDEARCPGATDSRPAPQG